MRKCMIVSPSDVVSIRVTCKNNQCGGVVEIPIDKAEATGPITCPCCKSDLRVIRSLTTQDIHQTVAQVSLQKVLADAVIAMRDASKNATVEFVMRDDVGSI